MGDKSREWKEPLQAKLSVFDDPSTDLKYELLFADADRGLGGCPYETPHDFPFVPVTNWMFRFVFPQAA